MRSQWTTDSESLNSWMDVTLYEIISFRASSSIIYFTIYLQLHPSDNMANDLSNTAEVFLWVGFSVMFGSFLIFYGMLRTTAPGKRLFHIYTCAIVGFASTAYLWMALGKYMRQLV
jgi:bacteriorhodopsin